MGSDGKIYLIKDQVRRDYNGRDYIDEDVHPDFGYFDSYEEAEKFVAHIDSGLMIKWEYRMGQYRSDLASWERKQERAHAQGFANPDEKPSAPWAYSKPLPHLIETVNPFDKSEY